MSIENPTNPPENYREDLANKLKGLRTEGGGFVKKMIGIDGKSKAQKLLQKEQNTEVYEKEKNLKNEIFRVLNPKKITIENYDFNNATERNFEPPSHERVMEILKERSIFPFEYITIITNPRHPFRHESPYGGGKQYFNSRSAISDIETYTDVRKDLTWFDYEDGKRVASALVHRVYDGLGKMVYDNTENIKKVIFETETQELSESGKIRESILIEAQEDAKKQSEPAVENLEDLELQLQSAIDGEDYVLAQKIKDQIGDLKNNPSRKTQNKGEAKIKNKYNWGDFEYARKAELAEEISSNKTKNENVETVLNKFSSLTEDEIIRVVKKTAGGKELSAEVAIEGMVSDKIAIVKSVNLDRLDDEEKDDPFYVDDESLVFWLVYKMKKGRGALKPWDKVENSDDFISVMNMHPVVKEGTGDKMKIKRGRIKDNSFYFQNGIIHYSIESDGVLVSEERIDIREILPDGFVSKSEKI